MHGMQMYPYWINIMWVSLYEGYTKAQREYDVAVIGLMWSISFTHALMPACLPDSASSDKNSSM